MRRTLTIVLTVLVVVVTLGGLVVARGDASSVTRARLERSLPVAFANRYVEQARLLGRPDLTAASLHASAMCDKHGPDVADVGPGGDWVCLMSWDDPDVPMPTEGYGKFELNVHSNDCYTAAGPTKLTGFLTLTDTQGREVTNPAFEFDGCFDPQGDTSATGVTFPSLLTVTSSAVAPDGDGRVGIQVTCGTGSAGCVGTVRATTSDGALGTVALDLPEESTTTLTMPSRISASATQATFAVTMT
ncbi:MAG: hypothetical protein F2667_00685, partial [Actinobacteria bacterium]|nr:hypothetical protein [Actinomycetota bacterium]